jgi:hypothetical protein
VSLPFRVHDAKRLTELALLREVSKIMTNVRRCTLYLAENRPAIVAPVCYNSAGTYFESNEPTILSDWRDLEELAITVGGVLAQFSFKEANLREHKRSDWPSYRASKCHSIGSSNHFICALVCKP